MRKNKSRKNMRGGFFGFFEKKEEPDNRPPEEILSDFKGKCIDDDIRNGTPQINLNKSPECPKLSANYTIAATKRNATRDKSVAGEGNVVLYDKSSENLEAAPKPWYIWGGRRSRRRKSRRNRRNRKSRK